MRFRLRLGRSGRLGRLTPEQEAVLKRLEARELTDEEAAAQLGGSVRTRKWSWSRDETKDPPDPKPTPAPEPELSADEAAAKELVERIAREVDAE